MMPSLPALALVRTTDPVEAVDASPVIAGDLESVFRGYARYVASVAVRLLGRDDEIDDVVQEVFLAAMSGLRQLREPAAIRGWLATVTVRIAQRKLRRRRLRAFVGLDTVPDYAVPGVAASQHKALMIVRAYRVLEGMPVADRIAWIMRNVEGEPLESVALICRCSLATAKRRIARAQVALDMELGE